MTDTPRILQEIASRATSVRVRNVINPLLWLSAVTCPIGLLGAVALQAQPILAAAFVFLIFLGPLAVLAAYAFFMVRDPNRLQSEEFVIAHQRLMLEAKGMALPEPADALPASSNPEVVDKTEEDSDV